MEAKRKQKAWEREGKKDHTNFMEIQRPCVACIVPETSARRVLALADILKKGRRLGPKNLRRAASVSTAVFSLPVSEQQKTSSKSVRVIWVFPSLKCCFRWATVMPRKK